MRCSSARWAPGSLRSPTASDLRPLCGSSTPRRWNIWKGSSGLATRTVANGLLDTGEALIGSGTTLADRLLPGVGNGSMPPATAAAVARLLESIGRTIAYAQDIAQVVLDRPGPWLRPSSPATSLRSLPSRGPGTERSDRSRERLVTPFVP